jgi:hypothetical protein
MIYNPLTYTKVGVSMANLSTALQQLRKEREQAQAQVKQLDQAISVIEGLSGRGPRAVSSRGPRRLSASARKRISEAQKARWAKRKKQSGTSAGPRVVARKPLSAAARRRIAAAQRARWAKFRSQQKAAA